MNRLAGLEALRGIAALTVLGLHAPVIFPGFARPFAQGYLGVDLFFLLSGLVLALTLDRRPMALTEAPRWFWQRYWRMWPVMALGGLIGAPLLWMRTSGLEEFAPLALANFVLLPVDFQRETFPLNVPAWTIALILLGNLLHVLVFRHFGKVGLALALAASLAWLVLAGAQAGSLDVGPRPENMLFGLPRLLFAYLFGIALWRMWGMSPPKLVPPLLALLAVPGLILGAWLLGWTDWRFDVAFVAIAAPLIVTGAMHLRGWGKPATLLGALSFPLYAVHFPVLIWARYWGLGLVSGIGLALLAGYLAMLVEARLFRPTKRAPA